MPGITVTAGMDASNYEAHYQQILAEVVAGNATVAASSVGSAAQQINAIRQQIAANTLWANSQGNVLLQQQHAIAVANYVAAANKAATVATGATAKAGLNLNLIFTRLLVILKDLARGQWARALSTFTSLLSDLGIAASTLITVLVGLGVALFAVGNALSSALKGITEARDRVGRLTEAIKAHIEAARDARDADRRWADEMARIGRISESTPLTKAAEEQVAAMRKKYELERKMGHGPSQQEEAKAEAAVYAAAAKAAKKEADDAKKAADETYAKNRGAAQKADENVRVAEHEAITAQKRLEEANAGTTGGFLPEWLGGEGFHPLLAIGNLSREEKVTKTETGALVNQSDIAMESISAEAALAGAKDLKDALARDNEVAQQAYAKAQRDADAAEEKAKASKEIADADAEAPQGGRGHAEGHLTEYQKIGAYAGASVSVIDVNRKISSDVSAIRRHMEHPAASRGGSESHPGGF